MKVLNIPLEKLIASKDIISQCQKENRFVSPFEQAVLIYQNPKLAQRVEIDPIKDTYLSNEYRYIRKHWVEITNKSLMIYIERYNEKSRKNAFLTSICCDFKMLEEKCDEWIKNHP